MAKDDPQGRAEGDSDELPFCCAVYRGTSVRAMISADLSFHDIMNWFVAILFTFCSSILHSGLENILLKSDTARCRMTHLRRVWRTTNAQMGCNKPESNVKQGWLSASCAVYTLTENA